MGERLNDAHGLVTDVVLCGAAADNAAIELMEISKSNIELIDALNGLNQTLLKLCDISHLAHRKFLNEYPFHLIVDVDTAPRKLKKAYWKLFENRHVSWREKQKLKKWYRRGNVTLDKLSGKQVPAQTPD